LADGVINTLGCHRTLISSKFEFLNNFLSLYVKGQIQHVANLATQIHLFLDNIFM
jgi:hypothetical protein